MRSTITITLILCVASIATAQTVIPSSQDFYTHESYYANWQETSPDVWTFYPGGHYLENGYYGTRIYVGLRNTSGPGFNQPDKPNGSSWAPGYETANYENRAVFQFDISALSGPQTNGLLKLTQDGWGGGSYNNGYDRDYGNVVGEAYRMTKDISDQATANSNYAGASDPWATPNGDYDNSLSVAFDITQIRHNDPGLLVNNITYIDVLPLLNAAIANGDTTFGVILIAEDLFPLDDTDDEYVRFSSSETSKPAQLIIPEPATMGMLVLGGLALLRRRRR